MFVDVLLELEEDAPVSSSSERIQASVIWLWDLLAVPFPPPTPPPPPKRLDRRRKGIRKKEKRKRTRAETMCSIPMVAVQL